VPKDVPVVLSSQAWTDYEVPAAPYFVYVSGESGNVAGEGSATSWEQIVSLFRDALADAAWRSEFSLQSVARRSGHGHEITRGNDNVAVDDGVLADAGVGPNHPSLYESPQDSRGGV